MDDGKDNLNGQAMQPADTAGLRQDVARKAKELAGAAMELEQAALFEEVPFEEAFVLPDEERAKRYTAAYNQQVEWRRASCIYMLAKSCPQQDIARVLHMNRRTVAAIASQEGRKIGAEALNLASYSQGLAGSFAALAEQKAHEAGPKDLMIMHGIARDSAINLRATAGATDLDNAIEVEQANEKLEAFREKLKLLKPGTVNNAGTKEQRIENAELSNGGENTR